MNDFTNRIIHGDCLEEMKKIPSNSIDLIFADPPYWMPACSAYSPPLVAHPLVSTVTSKP